MKSAITISIDRDLLRASRSAAFAARRTLSSQIEQWIDEKLTLEAATAPAPRSAVVPLPVPTPPSPAPCAASGPDEETAEDLCATAPPPSTITASGPPPPPSRRRARKLEAQEVCS